MLKKSLSNNSVIATCIINFNLYIMFCTD